MQVALSRALPHPLPPHTLPPIPLPHPTVFPNSKCKLRLLKLERIKDFLLMEQEYIQNQEVYKPREETEESERAKVDDLRGTPMSIGTLEELIDDKHAIVSSNMGPEYYVTIMSFVNKDLLETGCSVLLHNKVRLPASPSTCPSIVISIA